VAPKKEQNKSVGVADGRRDEKNNIHFPRIKNKRKAL
jgi:hypothetical protein